jgi:nitrogen fixation NifU-like protein
VTSDLRDLYQEVILDHGRHPRNFHPLPDALHAEGHNPLCGDRVTVFARLVGDRIADLSFEGSGCAISTASASLMTERLRGRPLSEFEPLFRRFHGLVTGKDEGNGAGPPLEKLEALGGVVEFPMRVKCATLAWHTLKAAIEKRAETVTTE